MNLKEEEEGAMKERRQPKVMAVDKHPQIHPMSRTMAEEGAEEEEGQVAEGEDNRIPKGHPRQRDMMRSKQRRIMKRKGQMAQMIMSRQGRQDPSN
jgi:hypothetical protein